ncbi:MAG: isochorismatase family protein, partial [Mycobacteriaceae bacterium]
AGVESDQCVYATLSDAACLGYDVILLTDASATTTTDVVTALSTTAEEETP